MSNIYVQEPPTEGKICLETSVGDIDIELWSRECPKACRNFVQLCLEGYYDKTKFFRVVPEFIVQGGDPTNTGSGGESVWGKPFKDEFHTRLRMVRRGLVCMANAGKDDNGSQFFFTLAATKELQNKHTIFGKVAGDTIYNMIRLGEGHIEDGDRPKYPHKILKTKVLINPFTDITPREKITQELEKSDKKERKSKMKATKDFKLLSFGEEAEGDEESLEKVIKTNKGKSKSAHDLAKDPTLAADVDLEQIKGDEKEGSDSDKEKEEDEEEEDSKRDAEINSIRNKLKRKGDGGGDGKKKKAKEIDYDEDEIDYEYENPFEAERKRQKEEYQKEIKALTRELKGEKSKKNEEKPGSTPVEEELTEKEKENDMLRKYHEEQKRFKEKKKESVPKKKASREEETLAILNKFKAKLSGIIVPDEEKEVDKEKEASQEKEKEEEDEEDEEELLGDDWMKNTLKFDDGNPVLAKDANTKDDDWFDIYDPRNPLNKRRREKDEKDAKGKTRIKSDL